MRLLSMAPGAVLAAALLAAARPSSSASLSGTVRLEGTGEPVSGAHVGASRLDAAAGTPAVEPIPVEWSAQTGGDGTYAIAVPDGTPGMDRLLVFTWSHEHWNDLWPDADTSGTTPRGADLALPGIVPISLAAGDTGGVDFAIAGNRSTARVLMRDGTTRLATDTILPSRRPGLSWPVILVRTPYDKSNLDAVRALLLEGYAAVYQDMRGRFASEGVDGIFRDDGWGANQDGYDTIEWIAAQPWSNGRVGMMGGSALGIAQLRAAGATPPHLVCAVPEIAAWDTYRDLAFPGGVFLKNLIETWLAAQGSLFRLADFEAHPDRDAWWDEVDMNTRLDAVRVPMLHIGGWWDVFAQGTLDAFARLQESGGPGARWNQKLVMGPWLHGWYFSEAQGQLTYPPQSVFADYGPLLLDWFGFWLKGEDTGVMETPPARYYVMGPGVPEGLAAPGNFWAHEPAWPPPSTPVAAWFGPGGTLSVFPPPAGTPPRSFDYDPSDPVPTTGGTNLYVSPGPFDNAGVDGRADVLAFRSEVLTDPVEITGRLEVVLYASSDRPDTDWMVKLEDEYPDGRAMLVMDQPLRARHRVSERREDFLVPGEIHELRVDLWSTAIVFPAGHRIRVAVTSSNFPRFDPNPNTGEPFRRETASLVARNTVYLDPDHPSHILLPVVDRAGPAPCPSGTEVAGLRVSKAPGAGGRLRLEWESAGGDPCHGRYRVYGSAVPSSWVPFARNPAAETVARSVEVEPAFAFWLVVSMGTDGSVGPVGHFGK